MKKLLFNGILMTSPGPARRYGTEREREKGIESRRVVVPRKTCTMINSVIFLNRFYMRCFEFSASFGGCLHLSNVNCQEISILRSAVKRVPISSFVSREIRDL